MCEGLTGIGREFECSPPHLICNAEDRVCGGGANKTQPPSGNPVGITEEPLKTSQQFFGALFCAYKDVNTHGLVPFG